MKYHDCPICGVDCESESDILDGWCLMEEYHTCKDGCGRYYSEWAHGYGTTWYGNIGFGYGYKDTKVWIRVILGNKEYHPKLPQWLAKKLEKQVLNYERRKYGDKRKDT